MVSRWGLGTVNTVYGRFRREHSDKIGNDLDDLAADSGRGNQLADVGT